MVENNTANLSSTDNTRAKQLLEQMALRNTQSEHAMNQFYSLFHEAIYRFSASFLSGFNEQDIESVTVETLYEVWRNADKFEGNSQVKTWVFGIAKFKALDTVRKRKKDAEHEDSLLADTTSSIEEDNIPFDELVKNQKSEWLAHCLNKLPIAQKESIYLLLAEGFSIQRISTVQKCPEGTVKTRIHHGKKNLTQCIANFIRA